MHESVKSLVAKNVVVRNTIVRSVNVLIYRAFHKCMYNFYLVIETPDHVYVLG